MTGISETQKVRRPDLDTMVVTGGAGFVGSNFVRVALASTRYRVVVVDALIGDGCRENLGDTFRDPRMTFLSLDVTDGQAMANLLKEKRPRWIVNFVNATEAQEAIEGVPAIIRSNIVGTFRLLEAAREYFAALPPADQERFRFLLASTDDVYGTIDSGRFTEQSPYASGSAYAASKAAAEQFVIACVAQHGLPAIITNSTNNYGPRQPLLKIIPLSILNAAAGRSLPVCSDGGSTSDWLYVEDNCEGILAALEKGAPGQRYNFGGDAEHSDGQVIDRILKILEEQLPASRNPALVPKGVCNYAQLKTIVKNRRGKSRRSAVVSLKARKDLGWRPRHLFDMGITKTVEWYLDQRQWYESIRSGERDDRAADSAPCGQDVAHHPS
jgi:dTDP-glucose 4,6-dehydratase